MHIPQISDKSFKIMHPSFGKENNITFPRKDYQKSNIINTGAMAAITTFALEELHGKQKLINAISEKTENLNEIVKQTSIKKNLLVAGAMGIIAGLIHFLIKD